MFRNRLTVFISCLAMAGLLLTACSDDDGDSNTGKKDAGAVTPDKGLDGGAPDQSATPDQKVSPDTKPSPDKGPKPDKSPTYKGVACTKDAECYPTAPFCDPTSKLCVECVKKADCKDNPTGGKCTKGNCTCAADTDCTGTMAMGAKCLTASTGGKFCGCKATTDCAKSHKGPTCNTTSGNCSCKANTECKTSTFTVCSKAFSSSSSTVKNCNTACKANADCSKELSRKVCDTTGGGCVACLKNADCAYKSLPWHMVCTTNKFCVECEKTADCTNKSLGNKCNTSGWCVCASHADCASNENGNKCHSSLKACSCDKDADCAKGKKCVGSPYLPSIKYCK